MKKRLLSVLLILALSLSCLPASAAGIISGERPSFWAEEQVSTAISNGLVPESLQGSYTQPITRVEFCALAVAVYEKTAGSEITQRSTFQDTSDPNVQKMAGVGVVSGVGDGIFSPGSIIDREQAATMLARLAAALGKPLTAQSTAFSDNAAISSWAIDAVSKVVGSGIMAGTGNNTFDPHGTYTREQSIITLLKVYSLGGVVPEQPGGEFVNTAAYDFLVNDTLEFGVLLDDDSSTGFGGCYSNYLSALSVFGPIYYIHYDPNKDQITLELDQSAVADDITCTLTLTRDIPSTYHGTYYYHSWSDDYSATGTFSIMPATFTEDTLPIFDTYQQERSSDFTSFTGKDTSEESNMQTESEAQELCRSRLVMLLGALNRRLVENGFTVADVGFFELFP